MARYRLLFVLLIFAVPAFAKSHKSKSPILCSELWNAVTQTLKNPNDYTLIATNGSQMKAVFSVFGARFPQIDSVRLKSRKGSCELQIRMGFTGSDDEWALRRRVKRALDKLEVADAEIVPKAGSTK